MLPEIPAKRYFTIGEVAELCDVKPHVLRYWEQEFTQLRQIKRRGNRRYYQHHEVLMIRRIRDLLYREGFTINGARSRLQESAQQRDAGSGSSDAQEAQKGAYTASAAAAAPSPGSADAAQPPRALASFDSLALREALLQIRELLKPQHGAAAAAAVVAPRADERHGGDPGHDHG